MSFNYSKYRNMNKNKASNILESKTPKVYKDNKLNQANFGNFTYNDYQVFLHLVSKVGGVDEEGKYLQSELLKREYTLLIIIMPLWP